MLCDQVDHSFDVPGSEEMVKTVYAGKMSHFLLQVPDNIPERAVNRNTVGFSQQPHLLLVLVGDDWPVFVH
jgi:hypothetical protein